MKVCLLVLVAALLATVACSDDKDTGGSSQSDVKSRIVGLWEKDESSISGQTDLAKTLHQAQSAEFKNNGESAWLTPPDRGVGQFRSTKVNYKFTGDDRLELESGGQTITFSVSMDGNKLRMKSDQVNIVLKK